MLVIELLNLMSAKCTTPSVFHPEKQSPVYKLKKIMIILENFCILWHALENMQETPWLNFCDLWWQQNFSLSKTLQAYDRPTHHLHMYISIKLKAVVKAVAHGPAGLALVEPLLIPVQYLKLLITSFDCVMCKVWCVTTTASFDLFVLLFGFCAPYKPTNITFMKQSFEKWLRKL